MPLPRPATLASLRCTRTTGRVGLLGGSFNPAHDGHRHISRIALRRLGLDEVWWLVSPQNPLKTRHDMAPLAARMASARMAKRHPRIRVSDAETRLGTRYTADTIAALRRRFPDISFVWLMGADNLTQIARWDRWPVIFRSVPVAVFARPTYSLTAMAGKAATRFRNRQLDSRMGPALPCITPPAWAFFNIRLHTASATAIRRGLGARG